MASQPSIVCPRCGKTSHNPNDVQQRYCGNCHRFHEDQPQWLPLDHPDAPKYWQHESSGRVKGPIVRYLEGAVLSTDDLTLIRLYLRQWFDSPAWNANPHMGAADRLALTQLRQRARLISSRVDIDACIEMAVHIGMDPL